MVRARLSIVCDWTMLIHAWIGSDVIRLNVLGHNIIILNSFKAAMELIDQRSAIYSDRFVAL